MRACALVWSDLSSPSVICQPCVCVRVFFSCVRTSASLIGGQLLAMTRRQRNANATRRERAHRCVFDGSSAFVIDAMPCHTRLVRVCVSVRL